MSGLGTNSWEAPMPDNLAEVHIEYPTGLRAAPGCSDDIVAIAVPAAAVLPVKPGCSFPENANPLTTILDRAQQWLRGLVH
jgi:hypothetical protein